MSSLSLRSYAYDARRLADFLASRDTNIVAATQDDLVAYRHSRTEAGRDGVSEATWQRDKTLITLVFKFLIQRKVVEQLPWITIGRRSPIDYPGVRGAPAIRFLSNEQWRVFREVGLGGQLPGGELDLSWRGTCPQRNIAGATLALSTGMRLREFCSVLDFEVPYMMDRTSSFDIEATAKFSRRRTVHVPAETLRLIHLYRRTERADVIRKTMQGRVRRRKELAVVHRIDRIQNRIAATFEGKEHVWDVARMPGGLRRLCVVETAEGLEPLSLFVGSNGLAIQQRAWGAVFGAASRRTERFRDSPLVPAMPAKVTAHDLRHTFAVVLLRYLMVKASERESGRRRGEIGNGSMSDHLVHSPILSVQRLLGHASPLTTMTYLRYVEDTEEIVRRALDTWSDPDITYADYISELFTRELK
ncbi:tyrosine-type recombinase/integrase [Arthrobacter sp. Hiyo1]|uniref:tyrosine-type recombinase/integrase n=1 Tax=Arthrobacter sp. Hiyo1 TaxID=1588020 RepID=UPI001559891F|nr:site-specific integrase [Arthrobacter sp. Hiyo1]